MTTIQTRLFFIATLVGVLAGCGSRQAGSSTLPGLHDSFDPQVAELIERAAALLSQRQDSEDLADELEKQVNAGDLSRLEETGASIAELEDRNQAAYGQAEELLQNAARRIRELDATVSAYAARKKVVHAVRALPCLADFVLKPERVLTRPDSVPGCPPCGERFQELLSIRGEYWNNPVYRELMELPADQLPDEAMIALCHLGQYNTTSLLRGDEYAEPVGVVIARYGARILPAAMEFLGNPDRYNAKAEVVPNALGNRWFHPSIGEDFFRAARTWPADDAGALFRAALEAGWNNAARHLPDADWARELHAEFADSPYGRPVRSVLWLE